MSNNGANNKIFRQAYELVTTKTGSQMTAAEHLLVRRAITALDLKIKVEPELDRILISEGLLKQAKIEEGKSHAPQKAPTQTSHSSGAKERAPTKRASLVGKRR